MEYTPEKYDELILLSSIAVLSGTPDHFEWRGLSVPLIPEKVRLAQKLDSLITSKRIKVFANPVPTIEFGLLTKVDVQQLVYDLNSLGLEYVSRVWMVSRFPHHNICFYNGLDLRY